MRSWVAGAAALCASAVVASSCGEEPPAIDSVVIDGNLFSRQVRQGLGPIHLIVTGRGLQYVTVANLEDLQGVTVHPGDPDGGVTIDALIPHALLPGPRALTLTLADNRPILTQAAVVEVTTIRATAQGDDASGRGTEEHPFRSLTKALSLSASQDEVDLGPGTYALVNGERWPAEDSTPPRTSAFNVKDGVVLKGSGSAVTLLDGTGLLGSAAALVFEGGGSAEGMTLKSFHRGVISSSGLVNLTDVGVDTCTAEGFIPYQAATLRLVGSKATGCAVGLRAMGSAAVDVSASNFDGNGTGVELDDNTHGVIAGTGITRSSSAGVLVASRGDVTLNGVTVDQNGKSAVAASSGVYVTAAVNQLHLNGGTLSASGGSGLYVQAGSVGLTQMTVTQNGLDGITLDGAAQALLDRTGVSRNARDGVRVTALADTVLDVTNASALSTNTGHGANIGAGTTTVRASTVDNNGLHGLRVSGNAGLSLAYTPGEDPMGVALLLPPGSINYCLSDERFTNALSAVSVVHATLNGVMIPNGLVAGPVDARPQYRIVNTGNQISFLQ
jgi:uncharacterized protein DUF1565/parallel beta helix pectate lyase-like protein